MCLLWKISYKIAEVSLYDIFLYCSSSLHVSKQRLSYSNLNVHYFYSIILNSWSSFLNISGKMKLIKSTLEQLFLRFQGSTKYKTYYKMYSCLPTMYASNFLFYEIASCSLLYYNNFGITLVMLRKKSFIYFFYFLCLRLLRQSSYS